MSPALLNGDYVITIKPRSFRPGSIYVINHIDLGHIIKRLDRADDDFCYFSGDNKASTPTTIIAPVNKNRVKGLVKWVVGPSGIKRPQ